MDGFCGRCKERPCLPSHRYCRECRNAYQRKWRRKNGDYAGLSEHDKHRSRTRAYANVYRKRGHLPPQPCESCGTNEVQMHHFDYDQPLKVTWLCRSCHLALHQHNKPTPTERHARRLAYQREYKNKNRTKLNAYMREWKRKHRAKLKLLQSSVQV